MCADAERFKKPLLAHGCEQQQLGFNYRMTDLQAALGLSQLERLDEIVAERNNQLQRYRALLADLPVRLLDVPEGRSSVHLAVIRLNQTTADQHRRVFEACGLLGSACSCTTARCICSPTTGDWDFMRVISQKLRRTHAMPISLPLYPGLQGKDLERVADTIHTLVKQ